MQPALRSMITANPQLREMMQNPELLRQMMNPETLQVGFTHSNLVLEWRKISNLNGKMLKIITSLYV